MIHHALLDRGHQSEMVVKSPSAADPSIRPGGNTVTRTVDNRLLRPLQDRLSLQCTLSLSTAPWFLGGGFRRADIVHLHVVHAAQFFSLLYLPALGRRTQLVWTMHDPWMTTGHCIHPLGCDRWRTGCGQCPDLTLPLAMRRDRTAAMWRLKHRIMKRSRVTLVVASRFMYEHMRSSPILDHLPCHIIPFGVPCEVFRPQDRARCRKALGLPNEGHVIAFRLRSFKEPYKGGAELVRALQVFRPTKPTTLLVLEGGPELDALRDRYSIRELGWVEDAETVACALNAADVFVMPSTAEAFGMMAVESMACGTPVIVCEGTALPEVVMAPQGGVAVEQGDPAALAVALRELLGAPEARRSIGDRAVSLARQHYRAETYIDRHLELYRELLED
jgi:glycosyltransferase involved in cell wall biosynthesis